MTKQLLKPSKSYSLEYLAQQTNSVLSGNPSHEICGVADLTSATATDISFLANPKYASLLGSTNAGIVCVGPDAPIIENKNYLISDDPSRTFQQIAELLHCQRSKTGFSGIHPTAVIHPEAQIGSEVVIGPYCVIDREAHVGDGTVLGPFVTIGVGCAVGQNCTLHSHVTIREYCQLGDRVILQPGAVIGSCGFGYTTDEEGIHHKLEQLGNVILEDDVEIGANSTIDRARFKTTRVGKGTKIDNLVQIGHNVVLGKHNIIAAQTGLAGSTKTGRNVMMGGQVGVVGHLEITDFVMIATRGGVSKTIPKSGKYNGSPAIPLQEYNRHQVHLRKIASYLARIEALEKKLSHLEGCK